MTLLIEKNTTVNRNGAQRAFLQLLDECVQDATIHVYSRGGESVMGRRPPEAQRHPASAAIRVHRDRFFSRVLSEGNLGLAESFMDGDFDMAEGEVADLLTILLRNRLNQKIRRDWRLLLDVLRIRLANAFRGKEGNIHQHYDVGVDLFESCLDSTMTYSCGYASSPDDDLERLQANNLDRICRKLRLQPGEKLLDIGCGFAGLLIHAAKNFGVSGLGAPSLSLHQSSVLCTNEPSGAPDLRKTWNPVPLLFLVGSCVTLLAGDAPAAGRGVGPGSAPRRLSAAQSSSRISFVGVNPSD